MIGVVRQGDRVLVGLRARPPFAGCHEFPGGKVRHGEPPETALAREVLEETGLEVTVGRLLARSRAAYPNGVVDLSFYLCRPGVPSPPQPRAPFGWVRLADLAGLSFPPANAEVLRLLPVIGRMDPDIAAPTLLP